MYARTIQPTPSGRVHLILRHLVHVITLGEGDHVHLLVEYPPTIALSELVNSLKDVSSRHLHA